jgi:hypothetical protein
MEARIELLRRRITLCRCYLREGASAAQALLYLKQIKQDETEPTAIATEGYHSHGRRHRHRFSAIARRYRELAEEEADLEKAAL